MGMREGSFGAGETAHAQLGLSPCPVCPPQLGQEGKVPLHSAYLYYNVTEKVRRMMESYFRLEVPLHFSYSHLVCRTAIDGERGQRSKACPVWSSSNSWSWSGLGPFFGDLLVAP